MRPAANVDLTTWLEGIQWWQLIVALIVVVVGWILARLSRKAVLAVFARMDGLPSEYAYPVARITEYFVIVLGIGVALAILGANIQPLLAVVIIVSVVAVLVLRGTADNFAASVLIQSQHPILEGDEIQVDTPGGALVGTVIELNARSVVVVTADGRTVHVPNSKVLGDSVVNHSTHGARRTEILLRLTRQEGESVEDLLQRVTETTAGVSVVHSTEPVRILITALTPERVSAIVQFWHDPASGVVATSDVVKALGAAFADRGVEATVASAHKEP